MESYPPGRQGSPFSVVIDVRHHLADRATTGNTADFKFLPSWNLYTEETSLDGKDTLTPVKLFDRLIVRIAILNLVGRGRQ